MSFSISAVSMIATFASASLGAVPTYEVVEIAPFTSTTTLRGASGAGHFVGDQVLLGLNKPFVATQANGLELLPLPAGYQTGIAYDVNDSGVIVGTVAQGTFPADLGEPAIWTPNGSGGFDVMIPQQFASLPSPLGGSLTINGGQAVAINNDGTIVGWSRFQGFQGGPSTLFSMIDTPVDLRDAGFQALARDINNNGVIVGDGLRLDTSTGVVTSLGVPEPLQPGNVGFTSVIAYVVNDSEECVVAADLASVPTENYLTYLHSDSAQFTRLNESQLPSRFVGFYDNNNRGDVSASGGVLFRAEGALLPGYGGLLDAGSSHWNVALGFIDDARRVYTSAINAQTGGNALVLLLPSGCLSDADGSGDVDFADLNIVLSNWGTSGIAGDFNGNGVVEFADLNLLLTEFGDDCND